MLSPPGDLLEAFSRYDLNRPLVAAVSGGSDSTALLLLLKRFIDSACLTTHLVAVTVDHGLRPEAADEALAVGRLAKRRGVEHRILRWDGPKPDTGLSAAAREARYGLLARVAEEVGADMILTAHTADDQAETVSMRQRRGDGLGLAGMAPATLFDGRFWIARPLLNTRRETLRNVLRENSVGWIDDPSNIDRRSERVRIRLDLAASHDTDANIDALLDVANEHATLREGLGRRAAALIVSSASQAAPGLVHLDHRLLGNGDDAAAVHALRVLLAVVGGMRHLPDEQRTAALAARLARSPHRATLSRTLIASRRDGIWLCRERRGLPEIERAREGMIWDGRFCLSATGSSDGVIIAPAGHTPTGEIEQDESEPKSLRRLARAAQPLFLRRDEQYADAGPRTNPAGFWTATPVLSVWQRFLPSFDIALARAVSALVRAPPVPDPPCAGHNVGQV